MDFIVLVLAAIAVHRIWNYEEIFAGTRGALQGLLPSWLSYPLTCKVCNGFWIGLVLAFFMQIDHWAVRALLTGIASYSLVRLAVWAYAQSLPSLFHTSPATAPVAVTPPSVPAPSPAADVPGCTDCQKKKIDLQAEQKRVLAFDKRVVLMTTLGNFNASYSLSSCVLDQARALATTNPKWLIQIWVNQLFDETRWPKNMPANVELRRVIPSLRWDADSYDAKTAGLLAATVQRELIALGNADIITHDLLFQAHYLNFAAAIHSIAGTRGFRWWHQAHSGPAALPERPQVPLLYRYSLPDTGDHRLLNLNEAHRDGFMRHYGLNNYERIPACPNVRDPRILYGASEGISKFIGSTKLLEADIVQILPVSTERSFAKGVQHVIKIFGSIKAQGKSVRLVIANAHANGNEKFIEQLQAIGAQWGMKIEEDLIFTSHHFPKQLSSGLSAEDIQMLFKVSNLFVFPSAAEASSLVLGEAAAAGCLLVVNSSVPALVFDAPNALSMPFGTSNSLGWPPAMEHTPDTLAAVVLDKLAKSPTNATQRHLFKHRSLEAVGRHLSDILA